MGSGWRLCGIWEWHVGHCPPPLLEFLQPGDLLLYSKPVYGGTHHFINYFLTKYGIQICGFHADNTEKEIHQKLGKNGPAKRLKMIYVETPANPTNAIIDLNLCRRIADHYASDEPILLAVDNTYMGPLWSQPLKLGADLVLYSATKYIGGHSDLIAGAVLGSHTVIERIKNLRTFMGNMAGPWTGWLLMRSLETLKVRMETQLNNAQQVAKFLQDHPKVEKVFYLGSIPKTDPQYALYKRQYSSPGAMLSFNITGGEHEAFQVLNHLKLIKLAVSLGGRNP